MINDLPDELLLHVLDCLDPATLLYATRLVSRRFKACAEDSLLANLQIQLKAITQAWPGDANPIGMLLIRYIHVHLDFKYIANQSPTAATASFVPQKRGRYAANRHSCSSGSTRRAIAAWKATELYGGDGVMWTVQFAGHPAVTFRGRAWVKYTITTPRNDATLVLDWKRVMAVYLKEISYDETTIKERNAGRYLPWTLVSNTNTSWCE